MRNAVIPPIFVLVLVMATFSCAKDKLQDPITPQAASNSSNVKANPARYIWGLWSVDISADRTSVMATPDRSLDMHLNTVRMLETSPCATCLTVGNIHLITPTQIDVEVTIRHPYPGLLKFTAFDVRGIFISKANYAFAPSGRSITWGNSVPRLINYEGFTSLFNPTEFPSKTPPALGYIAGKKATGGDLTSTLNPFIAYRKDAPRRMFEAGGEETRTFRIQAPAGPIHFGYAVDVSWYPVDTVVDPINDFPVSANCLEAYAISVDAGAGLLPEDGGQTGMEVKIFDHQGLDSISPVSVYSPEIFNGEVGLSLQPNAGEPYSLFAGMITNELSAGIGFYPLLVRATGKGKDPNLGQIDAWQVYRLEVRKSKGWARTWGGSDADYGYSVAVDGMGNLYVTGWFAGTVDFDPGPGEEIYTSSTGEFDNYISKFDSDGNFVWVRTWGNGSAGARSIALDGAGNMYVGGYFMDTMDFDPGATEDIHTSNGQYDTFLSRFDTNGNFIWARTWGGLYNDQGWSIAIDGSGSAYVAGWFAGTTDFDPTSGVDNHASNGGIDDFLVKIDNNGNFLWARTWGGAGTDYAYSVTLDLTGNLYITGDFNETVDFDPGSGVDNHTSNGNWDVFLSKLDQDGNFIWARTWGGPGNEDAESVAHDGSGTVYVAGSYQGTVDFDPGSGVDNHQSPSRNYFLSKFDQNGTFIWVRTVEGYSSSRGYSVAISDSGDAFVTGYLSGTADLDPGPGVDNHTSQGSQPDVFLCKFDLNGSFMWARTFGGSSTDFGYSVAINGSGDTYISGAFSFTVDFDPGLGVDNHTANGVFDAFLSKFPPDGNW